MREGPTHHVGVWAALGVGTVIVSLLVTSAIGAGLGGVGASATRVPQGALVLPAATGIVSAEPIFEDLPAFTSVPTFVLRGRVPSFAIEPGRQIELVLNGVPLGAFAFDEAGRFGSQITLRDGPNIVIAKLVAGKTVIAQATATTVLDRTAPPLTISRPKSGDSVDGPDVVVEGKTSSRSSVQVNERIVSANPDGTFAGRLSLSAGSQTISVVARNEAGVETKVNLTVTVRSSASAAPVPQIAVTLDRTRVKPGETVSAAIAVTSGGAPRANVTVTLSVGVVTIGTARSDVAGRATIAFAAPTTEGDIAVVVLGEGGSGRATLTVAK